jgi:hypothetical protein
MSSLHARDGISTVQPPLSQAVGYVVVVVIGVIIALGEYFVFQYILTIFQLTPNSNDAYHESLEENHRRGQREDGNVCIFFSLQSFFNTKPENRFMTANRTVRTGLTASAVISVSSSPPAARIPTDK